MKKKQRKALAISMAVFGMVAAVAIPVGIVFGLRKSSVSVPETVNVTSASALPSEYAFGTKPKDLSAPTLEVDGYNPSDYSTGKFFSSTVNEQTAVGTSAAEVVFVFEPKEGKTGPKIYVTYPLNVIKGTPTIGFGGNNSGTESASKNVQYGMKSFAQVEEVLHEGGISGWLEANGYQAYKLKTGTTAAPNPNYINATNGTPLTVAQLETLANRYVFTGTYEFEFDTERFNEVQINGVDIVKTGSLRAVYYIIPFELPSVSAVINAGTVSSIAYGTTDFKVPTPPAAAKLEHYSLSSATPTITVKSKPAGSTNTPAVDQPVDTSKISTYEPGTVFAVTFSYRPDAPNYTGGNYSYVYTYQIISAATVYVGNTVHETYNSTYKEALKTDFLPLTLPENDGRNFNYERDTASITYEVRTPANDGTGPKVGDKLKDLTGLSTYGAGTEIVATIPFKPKANYTGATVITTRSLFVTKKPATTFANPYALVQREWGKVVKPDPVAATAEGYKPDPIVESILVTAQSDIKDNLSPAIGADASNWAVTSTWNPGTKIEITYRYDLDAANYSGEPLRFTQTVEIVPVTVSATGDKDNQVAQDYAFGSDIEPLFILPAAAYDTNLYYVDATVREFYVGGAPSSSVVVRNDVEAIKSLAVGTKFTIRHTLRLRPYYTSSKTNYWYRQVWTVV